MAGDTMKRVAFEAERNKKMMKWHGIWTLGALVCLVMCIVSGHEIAKNHAATPCEAEQNKH